jgi:hypothetical protein
MVLAILSSVLILSVTALIVVFLKYRKLKNTPTNLEDFNILKSKYDSLISKNEKIIEALKKQPLRHGYFETPLTSTDGLTKKVTSFSPIIFVEELDRFTDGTCEVQIVKIIPKISSGEQSHDKLFKYIEDNFSPIKKISDITWLESETEIKELRKHKIQNILKNIDDDNN